MQQATKQKLTIPQKTEYLEKMTGHIVNYMTGGKYWIQIGHKIANVIELNEKVGKIGLTVQSVSVNGSNSLTFQLGEIQ